MGKAELRINISRTDRRVVRSLILETNSPSARQKRLSVEINVIHDNIIFPNDRLFARMLAGAETEIHPFYLISYNNEDLKITDIIDRSNKFNITFTRITDFEELKQDHGPRGTAPRGQAIDIDNIKTAWRIDIPIVYEDIKDDFADRNQQNFVFTLKTNDENFDNIRLTQVIAFRQMVSVYPQRININKDQISQDKPLNRRFYITSEDQQVFKIKNIRSNLDQLSFNYDTEASSARHNIELFLEYAEDYNKQTGSIIIEIDHHSQKQVELPIFLMSR